MKSFEGYLKQTAGDTYLLLAGGGIKPLSDILASGNYVEKTGDTMTGTLYVSGQPGIQTAAGTGNWNYIRMHNGSNFWDFATLSSLNSGALEFRPAGASNIGPYITPNGMFHFNNINNSSWNYDTAAAWIREYHYSGAGSDTWGLAPRLAWHWGGRVAAQIGLASNGWLYEAPNTGTSFYRIVCETGTWGINITGSSGYASSAGNADTVDGEHAGSFAHVAAANNFVFATNEITWVPSGYSGILYLNYRTTGANGNLSYRFCNGSPSLATITAAGFDSGSDIRLKTHINSISKLLPIVEFDWKENNKHSYGLIALQVEKKYPELVSDGDVKTINYAAALSLYLAKLSDIVYDNNINTSNRINMLEKRILDLELDNQKLGSQTPPPLESNL